MDGTAIKIYEKQKKPEKTCFFWQKVVAKF
jgi:hypothetical protein